MLEVGRLLRLLNDKGVTVIAVAVEDYFDKYWYHC